jgi:hypothetical protein
VIRSLVLACACVLLAAPAPASAAARACPRPLVVDQQAFDVHTRGGLACRPARRALRVFIRTAEAPAGWVCARGHGGRLAATCAREARPRRIARAYTVREV